MKPFTIATISFFALLFIYKYKTILDSKNIEPRFKTEYRLEVINSDSIRILTSEHKLISCKFNELQEVIIKDNQ